MRRYLVADLLCQHSDSESPFHFSLLDLCVVMIGRFINANNDILYLNFSTVWHLLNVLCDIGAGPPRGGCYS
jgi:hypothetical protein